MSHARTYKPEGAGFTIEYPEDLKELFVEGVTSLAVGYPYSKLILHSVRPPLPNAPVDGSVEEKRLAVLQLAIPTAALLELCLSVVNNTAAGADQLTSAAQAMQKVFSDQVSAIRKAVIPH